MTSMSLSGMGLYNLHIFLFLIIIMRLCKGVLGNGENGVQKYREQGVKKTREQGEKESNLGSREQGAEDSGHCIKNLTRFLGFFFAQLCSAHFLKPILLSTMST